MTLRTLRSNAVSLFLFTFNLFTSGGKIGAGSMRGQRDEFRNFFYEGNSGIYVKKAVELAVTI